MKRLNSMKLSLRQSSALCSDLEGSSEEKVSKIFLSLSLCDSSQTILKLMNPFSEALFGAFSGIQ